MQLIELGGVFPLQSSEKRPQIVSLDIQQAAQYPNNQQSLIHPIFLSSVLLLFNV